MLIGLITSFNGCKTVPEPAPEVLNPAIQRPAAPALSKLTFIDKDGGLWLSYDEYRKLEGNIIAMKAYSEKLEAVIGYYEKQ